MDTSLALVRTYLHVNGYFMAMRQAIGRIGCLFVGDDYGRPTELPWGIAFPKGLPPTTVPVHPTQLDEAAAWVPRAILLFRWQRQDRHDAFVLGAYLVLAGAIRFAIEFVRVNERVLCVLSVTHLASLMVVLTECALLVWCHRSRVVDQLIRVRS